MVGDERGKGEKMFDKMRVTISVAMVAAVAACGANQNGTQAPASNASASSSPTMMNNAELTAFIPGFSATGNGFAFLFQKDGKLIDHEGGKVYAGTWRINGDTVCSTLKEFHHGKEVCHAVIPQSALKYKVPQKFLFKGVNGVGSYVLTATD